MHSLNASPAPVGPSGRQNPPIPRGGGRSRQSGKRSRYLGSHSRSLGNDSRKVGNESRNLRSDSRWLGSLSRNRGSHSRRVGSDSRNPGSRSRHLFTSPATFLAFPQPIYGSRRRFAAPAVRGMAPAGFLAGSPPVFTVR